jgi:hypothetical protein
MKAKGRQGAAHGAGLRSPPGGRPSGQPPCPRHARHGGRASARGTRHGGTPLWGLLPWRGLVAAQNGGAGGRLDRRTEARSASQRGARRTPASGSAGEERGPEPRGASARSVDEAGCEAATALLGCTVVAGGVLGQYPLCREPLPAQRGCGNVAGTSEAGCEAAAELLGCTVAAGGVLGQHPPCCEPLQAQRSCSSVAGTPDRGGRSGGRLRGGTDCGGREATTPTWPEGSGGTRGEDAMASTPTQSSEEELWRGWFGGRACAGNDGGGSLWSACPTGGVAAHKRTEDRLGVATTPYRRTGERSGGGAAAEGRPDEGWARHHDGVDRRDGEDVPRGDDRAVRTRR